MRHLASACLVATCVAFGAAPVSAHEVTSKGSVVSVDQSKPDEKAVVVNVATVDDKASKTGEVTFYLDPETRIFRGQARVTFAQVTFAKGEPITITVDHDLDEQLAIEIHLDPKP
jgi:hypothetical protein